MANRVVLISDTKSFPYTGKYVKQIAPDWDFFSVSTTEDPNDDCVNNYLRFMKGLKNEAYDKTLVFVNAHGIHDMDDTEYYGFSLHDKEGTTVVPPDYFFDQLAGIGKETAVVMDSCGSGIYLSYAQDNKPEGLALLATSDRIGKASFIKVTFDNPPTGELIYHIWRYTAGVRAFLPFIEESDLVNAVNTIINNNNAGEKNPARIIECKPGLYRTVDEYII